MPIAGHRSRITFAARSPSSVCVGGIRMSTIATSGRVRSTQVEQLVSVGREPDDLETGLLEQSGEALAQDHRIVGQGYSHGISARRDVPRPGGLETVSVPPSASMRSARPAQTRAAGVRRAADAVVGDLHDQPTAVADGGHLDLGARASAWRHWSAPRWRRSRPPLSTCSGSRASMSDVRRVGQRGPAGTAPPAPRPARARTATPGGCRGSARAAPASATVSASRVSRTSGAAAPSAGSRARAARATSRSTRVAAGCRRAGRARSVAARRRSPRPAARARPGARPAGRELGLQPLVLERQPAAAHTDCTSSALCSSAGSCDQHRDRLTIALDRRRRRPVSAVGQLERAPVGADVAVPAGQPERELQRRIAERPRKRFAQIRRLAGFAERHDQSGNPAAGQPPLQEHEQHRDRHQRRGVEEHGCRQRVERVAEQVVDHGPGQRDQHRAAGHQHGRHGSPQRAGSRLSSGEPAAPPSARSGSPPAAAARRAGSSTGCCGEVAGGRCPDTSRSAARCRCRAASPRAAGRRSAAARTTPVTGTRSIPGGPTGTTAGCR